MLVLQPIAGGKLVLNQSICGGGIGHAQQRFGKHHQSQAFLRRQRVNVKEILDVAEPSRMRADGLNQPPRARVDALLGGG